MNEKPVTPSSEASKPSFDANNPDTWVAVDYETYQKQYQPDSGPLSVEDSESTKSEEQHPTPTTGTEFNPEELREPKRDGENEGLELDSQQSDKETGPATAHEDVDTVPQKGPEKAPEFMNHPEVVTLLAALDQKASTQRTKSEAESLITKFIENNPDLARATSTYIPDVAIRLAGIESEKERNRISERKEAIHDEEKQELLVSLEKAATDLAEPVTMLCRILQQEDANSTISLPTSRLLASVDDLLSVRMTDRDFVEKITLALRSMVHTLSQYGNNHYSKRVNIGRPENLRLIGRCFNDIGHESTRMRRRLPQTEDNTINELAATLRRLTGTAENGLGMTARLQRLTEEYLNRRY